MERSRVFIELKSTPSPGFEPKRFLRSPETFRDFRGGLVSVESLLTRFLHSWPLQGRERRVSGRVDRKGVAKEFSVGVVVGDDDDNGGSSGDSGGEDTDGEDGDKVSGEDRRSRESDGVDNE